MLTQHGGRYRKPNRRQKMEYHFKTPKALFTIHAASNHQLQIPARRETQKCETNPIPTAKMRNEPNLRRPRISPWSVRMQKCETNPIPVRARHAVPQMRETNPISTRPTTQLCETNPIHPTPTIITNSKMRNEPNLPLPQLGPRPNYAKRTQLPPGQQPTPNSQSPTAKKCETNPIPAFSLRRERSAVQ